LALAKLKHPEEKLLIDEALARLKTALKKATGYQELLTWEKLGFQNEETPETDIRGAGVLGILLLLYLAEADPSAIMALFESATRGPTPHEYPLVLTSFQVTCTQLCLLKDQKLKRNPYSNEVTLFAMMAKYHGRFLEEFRNLWDQKQLTIVDF